MFRFSRSPVARRNAGKRAKSGGGLVTHGLPDFYRLCLACCHSRQDAGSAATGQRGTPPARCEVEPLHSPTVSHAKSCTSPTHAAIARKGVSSASMIRAIFTLRWWRGRAGAVESPAVEHPPARSGIHHLIVLMTGTEALPSVQLGQSFFPSFSLRRPDLSATLPQPMQSGQRIFSLPS
jgi:hypothetical protein